jgi:hypothetical protein
MKAARKTAATNVLAAIRRKMTLINSGDHPRCESFAAFHIDD